jgi:HEAT repeat protein
MLAVLLLSLFACQEPTPVAQPERDRGRDMHVARGAASHVLPHDGPWAITVFASSTGSPDGAGEAALAEALGVALTPSFKPPRKGEVAVLWLDPSAASEPPKLQGAGGAIVFVVGPADTAERDRWVQGLAMSGAGVVDTRATLARWGAADVTAPATAGAAAAWELARHFNGAAPRLSVAGPPALAAALGATPSDGPAALAWAARAWAAHAGSVVSTDELGVRLAHATAASGPALVALSRDPEPLVRARAADRIADPVQLTRLVADPSSVVRVVAADRLAALARAASTPAAALLPGLEAAAASPDAYVRWKAASGLAAVQGGLPAMLRLLEDVDIDVQREAARSAGALRDPAIRAALEELLQGDNSFVRAWAAHGLGELGDPAAVPALRAAVRDPAAMVAQAAADSARLLGTRLQARRYEPPRKGSPSELVALATGPDPTARKDALKMLAGTPEGTAVAIVALSDRDSEVRKLAVESLGWSQDLQPALLDALDDTDPDVLVTALQSLRRRPIPGSAARIAVHLSAPDTEIRIRAAQALSALGEADATVALDAVRADPDERVRAASIRARPGRLSPDEASLVVLRAAAAVGGRPCHDPHADPLVRAACPEADPHDAAAALGLLALEDDLLHVRFSWNRPEDRPPSHSALRPPVIRPYGDPDRG